jgi:hypothetical protein
MTLYSKNGSIPKPQTDGTEGWIEVPESPIAGEGQETIWWYPPGWVVRPVEPEAVEGKVWDWSQSSQTWNLSSLPNLSIEPAGPPELPPTLPAGNISL